MDTEISRRVRSLVRRQNGVVTRTQLIGIGIPKRTLARRVEHGNWISVGQGVLVAPGTPNSLASRSRIVGLQVPEGILTGPSSAALIGGRVWEGTNLGRLPWMIHRFRAPVARYLSHPKVRVQQIGPWRVACTFDAVIDMIRLLPPSESRTLAYRAVQCRVLSESDLVDSAERFRRCAGVKQLRVVCAELGLGARSEAERVLLRLLQKAGIAGWICSFPVQAGNSRYELDAAFPQLGLAIEVDGYAFHSARDRFVADRQRQNDLVNDGWTVLRFTWDDLKSHPDRTIQVIRTSIGSLSAH